MSLQGAEFSMKFCTCASFSYGSIYYIYIPCPINMVETKDILVRMRTIIVEQEINGSNYDTLYWNLSRLYDDIQDGRV
jgi:hypothetical protein